MATTVRKGYLKVTERGATVVSAKQQGDRVYVEVSGMAALPDAKQVWQILKGDGVAREDYLKAFGHML